MDNIPILAHLPNWNRFTQKYHPDPEFVEAFLNQLSLIEDASAQEKVSKQINIEIGILLLHDIEINTEMYHSILESIKIH